MTFVVALLGIVYQAILSVRVGANEAISQTLPYLQMYEGETPWTPFSRRPLVPFLARQVPEIGFAQSLEVPAFVGFAVVNFLFLGLALVAVIAIWRFLVMMFITEWSKATTQSRVIAIVGLLCVFTVFLSNGYTFRLNFSWPAWTDIAAMSLMVSAVALALWSARKMWLVPILWGVCLLLPLTREITVPQMMAFFLFGSFLGLIRWLPTIGALVAMSLSTFFALSLPSSGAQYTQFGHIQIKLESHSLGFILATLVLDIFIATGFGWIFFTRKSAYQTFSKSLTLIFGLVLIIFAMTVVQLTDNGRFLMPAVILFWLVFAGVAMRDSSYIAPLVGSTVGYFIIQNPFQLDGIIRYVQPDGTQLNSVSAEFFAFGTQITDFATFLSLFAPQVVAALVVTLAVTWALRAIKPPDWSDMRRRKVTTT
jgi:hypothetical protein